MLRRIVSAGIKTTQELSLLSTTQAKRLNISHCVRISLTTSRDFSFRKMGDKFSGLSSADGGTERPGKIKLSDEEWKARLSQDEYRVARKHGTERAFTGELLENKEKGVYVCSCCGAELFSSSVKFDSGSGWPSFSNVLKDKDAPNLAAVDTHVDTSAGMVRTEVICGKCDAHLGHVFNDGPGPTGQRYCINSVCLKFRPDADKQGH